jgi:hypothetical protein
MISVLRMANTALTPSPESWIRSELEIPCVKFCSQKPCNQTPISSQKLEIQELRSSEKRESKLRETLKPWLRR